MNLIRRSLAPVTAALRAALASRADRAAAHALYEQITLGELHRVDGAEPWKMGNIEIGNVAYGSLGTSAVHVAGTIYMGEIFIPRTKQLTGIGVLNGAIVGTDNLIVALYDVKGRLLMTSALAGVLSAGANAFQEIPFRVPYQLMNDGTYYLALQCNGVTATTRRIAASTFLRRSKTAAGTFGTIPTFLAPPTSFAADASPIGYVY